MEVELLNQRKTKKEKKQHTAVPKKLNAKKQRFLPSSRGAGGAVWGGGGRCLEQRRVEKSSVVQPGSKWLSAREELPHTSSQATQERQARRSTEPWGLFTNSGQKPPQLRLLGDNGIVCSLAKPRPVKSWCPTEKAQRFLGFLGLDFGSRILLLRGGQIPCLPTVTVACFNHNLPPDSATASHRSLTLTPLTITWLRFSKT